MLEFLSVSEQFYDIRTRDFPCLRYPSGTSLGGLWSNFHAAKVDRIDRKNSVRRFVIAENCTGEVIILVWFDRFTGGMGEAASHVGEGLATGLQCLQDMHVFRSPLPEGSTGRYSIELKLKKKILIISTFSS